MKAILVIEMPQDCVYCPCWRVGSDEFPHDDCTSMQRPLTDEEEVKRPSWCPLIHFPQMKLLREMPKDVMTMRKSKRDYVIHRIDVDNAYTMGWNDCLREITGETDKEELDDMDIIRKWERYCDCGAKMIPNETGGWECPVCHKTMKSILFKRVTGDKS